MPKLPILPLLLAALSALPTHATAAPHRGVWFWNTTKVGGVTSDHSSSIVVGDSVKEDDAIHFMNCHGVKEVYGSYKHRPRDFPTPIRAWNSKLDAAGIESQLLISGFEAADPTPLTDPNHTSLVTKVYDRLIDFNNGSVGSSQMFDALHLDLEPQSLDHWQDFATAADKRVYLDHLLDAYIDIRAALDTEGYGWIPMYADIPYTWDKLPADGGSIGWTNAADRDGWYAAIDAVLDGISVMTFSPSKDTLPELADATLYERTGAFTDPARVAIQPKVGPGEIWPTYPTFTGIVTGLEAAFGAADIENYAFWRHAYADFGPVINPCSGWISAVAYPEIFKPAGGGGGGVIIFHGSPGYLYQVKHNTDLGEDWGQAVTVRTRGGVREEMRVPISTDGPRGFWIISEEEDETPTQSQ